MTYDMQKKTKGLACCIYQNKAKCVRLCFFKLIYAHIHDLWHAKHVVQACRDRAFTFSIKFLWTVTNNNIVIPVCFHLYVPDSQIQIQGGISLLPHKKNHREGNLQNLEWSTTS